MILRDNDDAGQLGAGALYKQLSTVLNCPIKILSAPMGISPSLHKLQTSDPSPNPPINYLPPKPTHFVAETPVKDITDAILAGLDVTCWLQHHIEQAIVSQYADYLWKNGVPDQLRTAVLSVSTWLKVGQISIIKDQGSAMTVYEAWQKIARQGVIPADAPLAAPWLQKWAADAGHNIPIRTVQRGLHQLAAMGLIVHRPFLPPTEVKAYYKGTNFDWKGKQPHQYYQLRPLPEALNTFQKLLRHWMKVAAHLDLGHIAPKATKQLLHDDGLSAIRQGLSTAQRAAFDAKVKTKWQPVAKLLNGDLLTAASTPLLGDYHNAKSYRTAYYKGILAVAGGDRVITRKKAAEQLGVTIPTLASIRRELRIVTEARYVYQKISDPDDLDDQVRTVVPGAENRQYGIWIEIKTERNNIYRRRLDNDGLTDWVKNALSEGDEVYFKAQVASRESFATESTWQKIQAIRQRVYAEHRERQRARRFLQPQTCQKRRKKTKPSIKLATSFDELPEAIAAVGDVLGRTVLNGVSPPLLE